MQGIVANVTAIPPGFTVTEFFAGIEGALGKVGMVKKLRT